MGKNAWDVPCNRCIAKDIGQLGLSLRLLLCTMMICGIVDVERYTQLRDERI